MQWLIFGSTGYTGGALLDNCILREVPVCAHVRPNSPNREQVEKRVDDVSHALSHPCEFELERISDLLATVQPSHIALCLGTTRARSKVAKHNGERHGYMQIDRDLSLMVIKAAQKECPSAKVIYISSMGADKPKGNGYLQARFDVEQYLMGSGLAYLIARPAFISGADRKEWRMGERFGSVVGDGVLSIAALLGMKNLQRSYASITANDLARSILSAAQSTEPAQLLYPQHLRFYL
jgi:nucleoside-diphosphate-sugar epimerase